VTAGAYRHFAIEQLADGVWAVLHRMDPPAPDAWAISNAGIVDLGDQTVLFDTLLATDAAAELRAATQALTGRPPDTVVYSHVHNDHTWGGSQFPEATFVTSSAARSEMLAEGREEVDDYRAVLADRLAVWSSAGSSEDPLVRHDAPVFGPYWHAIDATLPGLELRYPDIGFDGRLQIHGQARHVELRTLGRAHAAGDVVMVVPDARVVFSGDLLFVGCHPYLADGDLAGLRQALEALVASGVDRIVPGHGQVTAVGAARILARYLDDVERIAAADPGTASIPVPYRGWGFARFFAANVAFCAAGGRQADQPST
jgi:glyoxylase-like metal-dependent hydrolase (beta-lactamase superfamily II)